jgi:hypothetical protein
VTRQSVTKKTCFRNPFSPSISQVAMETYVKSLIMTCSDVNNCSCRVDTSLIVKYALVVATCCRRLQLRTSLRSVNSNEPTCNLAVIPDCKAFLHRQKQALSARPDLRHSTPDSCVDTPEQMQQFHCQCFFYFYLFVIYIHYLIDTASHLT